MMSNWFDVSNPQIMNEKSNTSSNISNGLTSESLEDLVIVGNNDVDETMHDDYANISIAPCAMNLNMADTLVRCPPRSHTSAQLSDSTQKHDELALKKPWLLIPKIASTPKSLAASSLEKLKVKIGFLRYPFSSSGNSHESRVEHIPVCTTASTLISIPSMSTNNSTLSEWITLEKRPTFPTQSRSDFLKNLSKKSFSKDMSCPLEKSEASKRNDTVCLTTKSRDAPLLDTSDADSLTEYNSNTTKYRDDALLDTADADSLTECNSSTSESSDAFSLDTSDANSLSEHNSNSLAEHNSNITVQIANVIGGFMKISINGEKEYSAHFILNSEREEIAFLQSLGWEENNETDEGGGLTEEEIQDFYKKNAELCIKSDWIAA